MRVPRSVDDDAATDSSEKANVQSKEAAPTREAAPKKEAGEAREKIDAAFGVLPVQTARRVLFDNAAGLYDVEAPDRAWSGAAASAP